MGNKKIKTSSKPKRAVANKTIPALSKEKFQFNLDNHLWLKGIQYKKFTNKLSSVEEYSEAITNILAKVIPTITEHSDDIFKGSGRGFHCHPIAEGSEEYKLALDVIREIYGDLYIQNITQPTKIYQIGIERGLRIITLRDVHSNVITPLFIDYHHLLYPSIKYNQTDYTKKEFCPLKENNIR